ncbi:MAG: UDP-N-acetylmuramoyl-L-alanine--D-glutamate ligase [Ignavibacteria bacterium]|nr:UDP-N-acetylmuramoyl-L-alanine--D-glutamate ligase [Ignavibacteria bacterium]
MKSVFIVGAGRSGLAAALLARRRGFERVFVSESQDESKFRDTKKILFENQIEFEFGTNTCEKLRDYELVVTSPGVPPFSPILKKAEELNVPIIGEMEFASWFIKNPIIAITGTNGKTTTTALINYALNKSGRKAVAAGNIGTPLSNFVDSLDNETIVVLEASSYQLDRTNHFEPQLAIILNIKPDHIEYHGTYENYRNAKFKIFRNQDKEDLLILNFDDKETRLAEQLAKGEIAHFSLQPIQFGAYLSGNLIASRFPDKYNEEFIMEAGEIKIPGIHNLYNSLAAVVALKYFKVRNEDIRDALMAFEGVEHRLEFVRTLNGVDFINDSKATNVDATYFALSSFARPLVWLAGGRADNNNYSLLDNLVSEKVKAIVTFGEAKGEIYNHFSSRVRCFVEESFEDAINRAYFISVPGDIVLLSPACKSFDMFINFEHRGRVFKEIVEKLK